MAKKGQAGKICREWIGDQFIVTITNTIISIVINILNFILRYLIKYFVLIIRETTLSGQMKSNQIGIFLTTFFNSGILVLLSTANFSEHKIPILSTYLKDGAYTDFHSAWYD